MGGSCCKTHSVSEWEESWAKQVRKLKPGVALPPAPAENSSVLEKLQSPQDKAMYRIACALRELDQLRKTRCAGASDALSNLILWFLVDAKGQEEPEHADLLVDLCKEPASEKDYSQVPARAMSKLRARVARRNAADSSSL